MLFSLTHYFIYFLLAIADYQAICAYRNRATLVGESLNGFLVRANVITISINIKPNLAFNAHQLFHY